MSEAIDIPAIEYHGLPGLSYSIAKILLERSPRHAWLAHPALNPDYKSDDTSRFDLGHAAHDALLEGGTKRILVIDPKDHRSKPNKANPEGSIPEGWTNNAMRDARDAARSQRLVPVLPWDAAKIRKMVDTAKKFIAKTEIHDVFVSGKSERSFEWTDNGVELRARLDWLTDDNKIILDYKTCDNAEPEAFVRQIASMKYYIQSAFYRRAVFAATGVEPEFIFLAQEMDGDHCCSLVGLSEHFKAIGDECFKDACRIWKSCVEANEWPAYTDRICYAEPPGWLAKEFELRM